jgi:hypothetical protein
MGWIIFDASTRYNQTFYLRNNGNECAKKKSPLEGEVKTYLKNRLTNVKNCLKYRI